MIKIHEERDKLFDVVEKGDLDKVNEMLSVMKHDVNTRHPEYLNRTLLQWAVLYSQLEVFQKLMEHKADIHIVDDSGWNVLHHAAYGGDVSMISAIMDLVVDLNSITNAGSTPLHLASLNGHIKAIELLLNKGSKIDCVDNDGSIPLHLSSSHGDIKAIELLLNKGSKIDCTDNDGDTPLHAAAMCGQFAAVKYLTERGANINAINNEGETPLLRTVNSELGDQIERSKVVNYFVKVKNMDITQLSQEMQQKISTDVDMVVKSDDNEGTDHSDDTLKGGAATQTKQDSVDLNVVMAYQLALKQGSRNSNQFKLVTLGAEGAGKTSTINTLLNKPFQRNQKSTVGASINSCNVDRHLASSKWHTITATFRIAEIPKQHRGEVKATMSLVSIKHSKAPAEPIPQAVIDAVKATMASEAVIKDGTIRIIVFDIGGQEVYYETHFLFLAIEDTALLVFDASKKLDAPVISRQRFGRFGERIQTRGMQSNVETIELLLHSVYSRGQKAPKGSISPRVPTVLMVGAHAENLSHEEQECIMQMIYKRFDGKPFLEHLPRLVKEAFHFIGNSDPDPVVVKHMRATILKAAEWVISTERPITYLNFEGKILEKSETEVRLAIAEATDLAKMAGIEGEQAEVDVLLRYFTNKGILLYYPEVPALKNEVFISPQEVSDLVSIVVSTGSYAPDTAELQRSYQRYNQHALLGEPLLDYMLEQSNRSKDKVVLLGLLDKFNLAAEVPPNTKFPREFHAPKKGKVFLVPSLLVYDEKATYCPQKGDISIVYYFEDRFVLESVFNQLLVKVIHWCCQKGHLIQHIYRGVGYFCFENGEWQQFQLLLSQPSIKCYITIHDEQPTSDVLPLLLQQRRELLDCLESFILQISKTCMPSAAAPVTCLECPLEHKDCPPHVILNIHEHKPLMCHERPRAVKIPVDFYCLLFQPSITPHARASRSSLTAPLDEGATRSSLTALLDEAPKMLELLKIVIPRVAAQWEIFAFYLEFQISRVDIIKQQNIHDPEESCKAMFIHWLRSSEGKKPKTWKVLLDTMAEIKQLKAVKEDIEQDLAKFYK